MTNTAVALKQKTAKPVIQITKAHLKPSLAKAKQNLDTRTGSLKRHREFLEGQMVDDLSSIRMEREQTQARYDALKSTVDQLVYRIQDMAQAPQKAQNGDISNIRTLLKQAYIAMERQQVELKGIRARTQRMERMAIEQDETRKSVSKMSEEFAGYQKAIYMIRKDMSELVETIEGEAGFKALKSEIEELRADMVTTMTRTDILEETARKSEERTDNLEAKVKALQEMVESNVEETEGISGALTALKEEVSTLNKKFFKYVIDQMKFMRKAKL